MSLEVRLISVDFLEGGNLTGKIKIQNAPVPFSDTCLGLPWHSSGWRSTLLLQGAQVRSLVGR